MKTSGIKLSVSTRYIARVWGRVWAGYKASTEYDFPGDTTPNRKQILQRAGDFQSVTRISVVKRTVTIERVKVRG